MGKGGGEGVLMCMDGWSKCQDNQVNLENVENGAFSKYSFFWWIRFRSGSGQI